MGRSYRNRFRLLAILILVFPIPVEAQSDSSDRDSFAYHLNAEFDCVCSDSVANKLLTQKFKKRQIREDRRVLVILGAFFDQIDEPDTVSIDQLEPYFKPKDIEVKMWGTGDEAHATILLRAGYLHFLLAQRNGRYTLSIEPLSYYELMVSCENRVGEYEVFPNYGYYYRYIFSGLDDWGKEMWFGYDGLEIRIW